MRKVTLILLLQLPFIVQAQSWYDGIVVLENKDILAGEVSYNDVQDIVSIRMDSKTFSYSAHQVQMFRYYIKSNKIHRIYYSISVKNKNGYQRNKFFEYIDHGAVSLYRRINPSRRDKYVRVELDLAPKKRMIRYLREDINSHHYYYLDEGQVKEIRAREFRAEILTCARTDNTLSGILEQKKLRTNKVPEMVYAALTMNQVIKNAKSATLSDNR